MMVRGKMKGEQRLRSVSQITIDQLTNQQLQLLEQLQPFNN